MVYDLYPGEYEIVELVPDNWEVEITIDRDGRQVSFFGDTANVKLSTGETITITFTNKPPGFVVPEGALGTIGTMMIFLGAAAVFAFKRGLVTPNL